MDMRIVGLLESLLLNVRVINGELERLHRSEQFTDTAEARQLCERLREAYVRGMEVLERVEKEQ
jgi:hypothetical protein